MFFGLLLRWYLAMFPITCLSIDVNGSLVSFKTIFKVFLVSLGPAYQANVMKNRGTFSQHRSLLPSLCKSCRDRIGTTASLAGQADNRLVKLARPGF